MSERRTADELLAVNDPAWPVIIDAISTSTVPVEIVEAAESDCLAAIEALQVSARSYLGALAANCAAITIDDGWLRVLGAGTGGLPSVMAATELISGGRQFVVVAVDAVGGCFAINGGDLPGQRGDVSYWGPDTLEWQPTGLSHSSFVHWAFSADMAIFYETLRWPGWREEVRSLAVDQGLSLWPPPFTAEGRNPAEVSRRAVPIVELLTLYPDLAAKLIDHADGTTIRLQVDPPV